MSTPVRRLVALEQRLTPDILPLRYFLEPIISQQVAVTGITPDLARAQMRDTLSTLEAAGLGRDPYQAAAWFLANVYDDHPQTADAAGAILIEARWYRDGEQGGEAKAWARLGSRTEAAQHFRGMLP